MNWANITKDKPEWLSFAWVRFPKTITSFQGIVARMVTQVLRDNINNTVKVWNKSFFIKSKSNRILLDCVENWITYSLSDLPIQIATAPDRHIDDDSRVAFMNFVWEEVFFVLNDKSFRTTH